jgi:predicted DNA-binding antitoxin AbrB/MazE fold protein
MVHKECLAMTTIEAIFEGGVFKPVGPVALPDKQRVRLDVRPVDADALAWFAEMRAAREQLAAKYGPFPDSTPDIAADRRRDG